MRCIVIVGGGFSGAATAIHLALRSPEPLDIRIVEPREALGAGVAHATPERVHRLNGNDAFHSPYPGAPQHFAEWLRASGALHADPDSIAPDGLVFARRSDFGRYMAFELARHAHANPSGSRIEHVRQMASRVTPGEHRVVVELGHGGRLVADHAILALGWNAVGVPPELAGLSGHAGFLADPWQAGQLDTVAPHAPVLLVGTGLTASDMFAALHARGHRGPVLSLSRRGLRPASQNPHRPLRPILERVTDPDPDILRRAGRPRTVRDACRLLRREIAAVDPQTSSWHTPFDELRDAAWLFWPDWAESEQHRFVRHARTWYDAFRFRNPPQVGALIAEAEASGRLTFMAGRLRAARGVGDAMTVEYDARKDGSRRQFRAQAVINCTGPQPRPSASGNPLWRTLLGDGIARDSPSGLGVDIDSRGRVLAARGHPQERLHAVGPPTIGRFGEVAAVPFIVRGILQVVQGISAPGTRMERPDPATAG